MSEKTRRGLEISITAVFVLALLLVGAVLIFSGGTASAKQFATLRLLAGQVAVQRGNGAFETGQDGTSLREGDTVRTGPDGRASIEYFDGSLTRLDFDTSFTLVTLETLGDAAASRVIESSQAEGNSFHRVMELTDAQSRFEIETPTATASVQGTGYALLVHEGSTTIAVVEGVVTAGGSTGAVKIPAGEMAVVGADGVVGPIQAIPPELLDGDWLMFNQCADHDAPECVEGDGGGPEGPTEPPKGSGQGEQGSVPPTSTTGAGGEGGTTGGGGTPSPPPHDQRPQAGFSATPRLGPAPLRVRFTDTSHDPDRDPLSRHWTFGDGSAQSGGQTLSHTYDDPGRYRVTLTVSDPKGKQDAESKVIQVGSAGAAFDHIIISPSDATIQPGGSQSYTAEAFDSDGGSMGNVTVDTDFSIAPNGSCNGNTCTANQPGAHTVTGTYHAESDNATLTVEDEAPPPPPPPPQCPAYALAFHVRPPANQAAGQQFNVQIRVDVLDDGSSDGPLSINLSLQGGTFSGGETSATWTGQGIVNFNNLTIDEPGSYAISASADCAISTDPTPITITDGSAEVVLDHIIISPSNATIQPGGSQSYTAEAFDSDGGSMGNVTVDTDFSIAPNGSCNGNTCTANQPGAHTVTGTYHAESDNATLTVEDEAPPPPPPPPQCPAYALAFHVRPPANQAAGQQFNVQIRVDVLDDGSSDGPLSINLSLQGGTFSGGETSATWTGQGIVNFNNLTIDEPGSYAISASADCAISTDPTPITITDGSAEVVLDHIIISPSNATIQPGGSQSYTAEAFDSDGGSMGNVTVDTDFSIAPNGSCNGNTCTANQPGAHTVTGTYHAESDNATLTVEDEAPPPPPPPPQCPAYALAFHVRPPANQAAGQQFNVQIRVDVLDDGSSDGPLSINLSLQGGTFSGGETSATWTGQGIVNFNNLTIDEPGSYAISASADCAISTDPTPITITESSNAGSKNGCSALGLVLAVPWIRRLRRGPRADPSRSRTPARPRT